MFRKIFAFAIYAIFANPVYSSDDLCTSVRYFDNFSVTSSSTSRAYDISNPIVLPCPNADFELTFTAESKSALFIAFSDNKGLNNQSGITEAFLDDISNNYEVKEGALANIITQDIHNTSYPVSRNYTTKLTLQKWR
ncbi:hypothetical protein AYI68_g4159 [Smittium mucronatum]|uniref:Uncharacterized protein n=1 Tax=Smittium mucronatum TaxID=133383 RepID=A0A1R0GXU8_9FUNG|nr:hypothetical protein AYI68_g4159 [Smittium mucronatum]